MTNDRKDEKKPGEVTTYSINEPGPNDPQPFKLPEDHTETTPETLERDYPDGYVDPDAAPEQHAVSDHADPDDLEDEIDQAKEDGDFKPMHKSAHKPSTTTKRK